MDSKHLPNIREENELEKKNKNHQENYMKPHKSSLYNGNIILEKPFKLLIQENCLKKQCKCNS